MLRQYWLPAEVAGEGQPARQARQEKGATTGSAAARRMPQEVAEEVPVAAGEPGSVVSRSVTSADGNVTLYTPAWQGERQAGEELQAGGTAAGSYKRSAHRQRRQASKQRNRQDARAVRQA